MKAHPHIAGTERRICFDDLVRHKGKVDAERRRVLDELSVEVQELKI